MKHRQDKYEETSKLQTQIADLQNYLSRTHQAFPQDITIDNKSGKELRLTIDIEDVQRTTSRLTSQNIPNNSSVTHIVNPDFYYLYASQSAENIMERSRFIDRNYPQRQLFPIRQEQRFLPISRIHTQQSKSTVEGQGHLHHSADNISRETTLFENEQLVKRMNTGNQILITGQENEDESDIINNQQIQELKQSQYVKNAYISQKKDYQNTQIDTEYRNGQEPSKVQQEKYGSDPINLPFSIKKSYKIVEPQTQETAQKQHHMNDNHLDVKQSITWSLKKLEKSNIKKADKAEKSRWKVQMITSTPTKIQFKTDNEKTYFEIQQEKSLFKRQRNQQRHERLRTIAQGEIRQRKSHYRCVNNNKQQQLSVKKSKRNADMEKKQANRADDLFIQRKDEYLRKLQQQKRVINSIRNRSGSKDKYIFYTTITTTQRQPTVSPSKNATLSPLIQQIGNRLHSSKGKIPCDHYNKFSKSQERERFDLLVKQNIYVSRYISREEREELFQSLIKSEDSVSLWATKIANFTFSKIRKVTSSRQRQFY